MTCYSIYGTRSKKKDVQVIKVALPDSLDGKTKGRIAETLVLFSKAVGLKSILSVVKHEDTQTEMLS